MQKKQILTIFVLINLVLGAWLVYQANAVDVRPVLTASDVRPATGFKLSGPAAVRNDFKAQLPTLLKASWAFYKGRFLVDGRHVVSNTYGGTITEGQSYALMKAVWMNDRDTFDKVWLWTRTRMARPHDHLLGWRWDEKKGLIETENATDADQDIAYALLLAGEKWQNPGYTEQAVAMIQDLWRLNVTKVGGQYYLVPGTWEAFRQEYLTIDPSYFAPYVYRKFAKYDPKHPWNQLADGIYDTLDACTSLTEPGLPPNWCAVQYHSISNAAAKEGQLQEFGKKGSHGELHELTFSDRQGDGARDFSYDAFRVYWRMAMDAALSPAPGRDRAKAYLKNHPFLLTYWQQHHVIPEGFTSTGEPRFPEGEGKDSGFPMGPLLIVSHYQNPAADGALYKETLAKYYHPEGYWFNDYNDFLHSVIWLHLYALSLQE